jgi:hypothetical protein
MARRTIGPTACLCSPALGMNVRSCRAADSGLAGRLGLLPDASRTLAGRPDSGPYHQVGRPSATVDAGPASHRLIYRSCRGQRTRVDEGVSLASPAGVPGCPLPCRSPWLRPGHADRRTRSGRPQTAQRRLQVNTGPHTPAAGNSQAKTSHSQGKGTFGPTQPASGGRSPGGR